VLTTIAANKTAIQSVAPYGPQLTALSKVPPSAIAYLQAHGNDVAKAAAQAPGQWKTWYWICFGGVIFFLFCVPLMSGRWRPADARRDEAEHEAMVRDELAKLESARHGA
jgi:hypothetical protein